MSCIFCTATGYKPASFPRPTLFNSTHFKYLSCDDCGLVYIDPLPSVKDIEAMYPVNYHEAFYFRDEPTNYSSLYALISPFLGSGSHFLDYGCGDGGLIRFLLDKGHRCTGIEFNPALVAALRGKYPEAQFLTVDEYKQLTEDSRFDAIYFGDVLEHITTPLSLLASAIDRLNPAGMIMAQGPLENNFTFALTVRKAVSSLVGGNKPAEHVPYHISFSDRNNQERLFRSCGLATQLFKVSESTWPYSGVWSAKPSAAAKYLVAKASIALGRTFLKDAGNRFVYVGKRA